MIVDGKQPRYGHFLWNLCPSRPARFAVRNIERTLHGVVQAVREEND